MDDTSEKMVIRSNDVSGKKNTEKYMTGSWEEMKRTRCQFRCLRRVPHGLNCFVTEHWAGMKTEAPEF